MKVQTALIVCLAVQLIPELAGASFINKNLIKGDELDELTLIVDKTISKAFEALDSQLYVYINKVKKSIDETREDTYILVERTRTGIIKLIKDAEDKGVDIEECTVNYELIFRDIMDKFYERIYGCTGVKIEKVRVFLEKASEEIRERRVIITKFKGKYEECKEDSACLEGVNKEIKEQIKLFPQEVSAELKAVDDEMYYLYIEIAACSQSSYSLAGFDFEKYYFKVKECAENKLK